MKNRSKHIALRFAFAKILYDNGQIKPVAVSSANQHADIGTKAVGAQIPIWDLCSLFGWAKCCRDQHDS